MVLDSDSTPKATARTEAQRLLNAVLARSAKWPKPTGMGYYQPRQSDIIVSTFPKAGTTLLQNMAYQIAVASGGAPPWDPDGTRFEDITEVAPWIDYGPEFGVMECDTNPRIFKTHGRAEIFDLTKAKYIYCIRNPANYPPSWLDFLFDILSEEEVKDLRVREEIFHLCVRRKLFGFTDDDYNPDLKDGEDPSMQPGSWFIHVKEWIHTPRPNILILFYEDMLRDLRGTVLCVARFMDRTLTPEALDTILKRCDRKAMAGNPKFNCYLEARAFGFSETAEKAKNESRPGYKQFKMKEQHKQILSAMMRMTFGMNSYEEFRSQIRQREQDHAPDIAYNHSQEMTENPCL